ncbi:MAG: helix-turn-helix transcriptional regulator [Clostridia bacterium]|nr:helix-turn-helix transcriptional regulator [Clostridia bacterium]
MTNELSFSQKILTERRKRGLTQEELANTLGVSAQAVSNWERGGYPDITMLPGIANYFKITIDELLGNDTVGQKEDIRQFFNRYFDLKSKQDREGAFRLALEYTRKYPQKYGIATLAADSIAQLPEDLRTEHLPTLRALCNRVIEEATDQGVRNLAIKVMCSVCVDDEVEKWYDMCPTIYNACLCEVKEERLWMQGKWEESRRQFDINNLVILNHLLFRPGRNQYAPNRAVGLYQFRLRVIELLAIDGALPNAWWGYYAELHFRLACALFGCDKKEDGYTMLEKALELMSKWLAIPDDTPLDLGDPAIFGDVKGIKGKTLLTYPDGSIHHERLERGFRVISLYEAMTQSNNREWFDSVREEPRFKECVERAKKMENK